MLGLSHILWLPSPPPQKHDSNALAMTLVNVMCEWSANVSSKIFFTQKDPFKLNLIYKQKTGAFHKWRHAKTRFTDTPPPSVTKLSYKNFLLYWSVTQHQTPSPCKLDIIYERQLCISHVNINLFLIKP